MVLFLLLILVPPLLAWAAIESLNFPFSVALIARTWLTVFSPRIAIKSLEQIICIVAEVTLFIHLWVGNPIPQIRISAPILRDYTCDWKCEMRDWKAILSWNSWYCHSMKHMAYTEYQVSVQAERAFSAAGYLCNKIKSKFKRWNFKYFVIPSEILQIKIILLWNNVMKLIWNKKFFLLIISYNINSWIVTI